MLALDSPAWIARDRVAGARAAVAAGATALVLDDAHQNPALKKTLSLIVVDGETRDGEWPFGDGSVFPSGPMREPLKAGLSRADAVVILLPADLAGADPELVETCSETCRSLSPVWRPPPLRRPVRSSASPASPSRGRSNARLWPLARTSPTSPPSPTMPNSARRTCASSPTAPISSARN
jgi:hypothetical protein